MIDLVADDRDDTDLVQARLDDAAKTGRVAELPPLWWSCKRQLTITDSDYVRLTGPGILVYTGTDSPFIAINSTTYTSLDRLRIYYTNPAFQGVLVQTSASGKRGQAVGNFEVSNCFLIGFQGATSAHALLDLDNANIVRVTGTQFAACQRGIRMATNAGSATVATTISGCSYVGCEVAGIFSWLSSTLESLTIDGCAFEPRADGSVSGILLNGTGAVVGLNLRGNWFGDRTTSGGGPWATVKATGAVIQANRFSNPGDGPDDYGLRLVKGSHALEVAGNVFDSKGIHVTGPVTQTRISPTNDFRTVPHAVIGEGYLVP
jgi:hypothetical protein